MWNSEVSFSARQITARLRELGDPVVAAQSQRFFKTGKGEYGEGDRFVGIRVPVLRKLAKEYRELPLPAALDVITSSVHEARLLALFILVAKFARGEPSERLAIYRAYLQHTVFINNWDLVDSSAEHIVGAHLFERSRKPLYRLARSKSLWERRIGIMATFHFVKRGDFGDTLQLAEALFDLYLSCAEVGLSGLKGRLAALHRTDLAVEDGVQLLLALQLGGSERITTLGLRRTERGHPQPDHRPENEGQN